MAIFKNPKVDTTDATAPARFVLHDHADLGGLRSIRHNHLDEAASPPVSKAGVDAPLIGRHVRACDAISSGAGDAGYSRAVGDQTIGAVFFRHKRLPAREKFARSPEAGHHIIYVSCQGEIPAPRASPLEGCQRHRICLGEPCFHDVRSIAGAPRYECAVTHGHPKIEPPRAPKLETKRTMRMIYSGTFPASRATAFTNSASGQATRARGQVRIAR